MRTQATGFSLVFIYLIWTTKLKQLTHHVHKSKDMDLKFNK
jgi:hypothetical protein